MNQGAYVTLVGFVAREPDLHYTASGVLVADVRIGTAGRVLDRSTGQWKDVEPQYFTVNCWRKMANYVKASFRKGDPVFVRGRLKVRSYIDKLERPRTEVEVIADVLGPDVSRTVANCVRPERPRREIDEDLVTGEENRGIPEDAPGQDSPDDPGAEGPATESGSAPEQDPASGMALTDDGFDKLSQLAGPTPAEAERGEAERGEAERSEALPAF